jgi:hypothetical protein
MIRVSWLQLGKGNDRISPIAEMMVDGGLEVEKFTRLKGERSAQPRKVLAIYDRYYVAYWIKSNLRKLLTIPKDQWLELCSAVWDDNQADLEALDDPASYETN